jgi:uncharacterized membrane protein YeiH
MAAMVDWRYLSVAVTAGLIAFVWSTPIAKLRSPVRLMDAIGLAFCAVAALAGAAIGALRRGWNLPRAPA